MLRVSLPFSIFPCIIGINCSLEQFLTISSFSLPSLFNNPNTGVFPAAPFNSYSFCSKIRQIYIIKE